MTENKFNLEAEYGRIKKTFPQLPDFGFINNEFEINSIDKLTFLIRQIRRKVNDKVIFFSKILEGILYPSLQSSISAFESNGFNEEEKNNLSVLYKKLMIIERNSLFLDVECGNENKEIEFIIEVVDQWNYFKTSILDVVVKMQAVWKRESEEEGERYFG